MTKRPSYFILHTSSSFRRASSRRSFAASFEAKRSRGGGFTIVETLVAVAVLMIAVAGPLVVASKGLTAAVVAKDQMIASYLAQDTMETIKNIRDNNLAATPPRPWYQGTGYDPNGVCISEHNGCDINGIDGSFTKCATTPCVNPIYYNDSTGYTHSSSNATKTKFTRYYYLQDLGQVNETNNEVIVGVIVEWMQGQVPYQVTLYSQLVISTR